VQYLKGTLKIATGRNCERRDMSGETLRFERGPWFNTELVIRVVSKIEVQFDSIVVNKVRIDV
jgi:hypothetical protein